MNDFTPDIRFAPHDETNTDTSTPTAHDFAAHDFAALDFATLAAQMATPDTPDTPDTPPPGEPPAALAEALIVSGALDAHIEHIVRHMLAEYDAQQNVLTRRAGGYRPGAFGSIG